MTLLDLTYTVKNEVVAASTMLALTYRVVGDPALIPTGVTELALTYRILGTHSLGSTNLDVSYDIEANTVYSVFAWDGFDWVPSRQRVWNNGTWNAA